MIPDPSDCSANITRGTATETQKVSLKAIHWGEEGDGKGEGEGEEKREEKGEKGHWGSPWEHLNQGSARVAIVSLITAQTC